MSDHKLFVYATLLDEILLRALVGKELRRTSALLLGYKETMIEMYPTLEIDPGEEVWGDLLTLTDEQIDELDDWESRYERRPILLDNGQRVEAYFLKAKYLPKEYSGSIS